MHATPGSGTAHGWENTVPVAPPATADGPDLPYARFTDRALAIGADLLLGLVVFLPLAIAAVGGVEAALSGWSRRLFIDLLPALAVVFFWLHYGATPGKMLMGLRVVAVADGGPLSIKRAVLRYIGYFLSALPLYLGFLWALWDRRRQGFHDKIAGTTVVEVADDDESRKDLATLMREAGCRN